LPGYRPSDGIFCEMRVLKLTEQQFFSIMFELLRMEGKREDGIERIEGKKWKGKMKGKGKGRREDS
jgi:hypothetical protein